jgi:hypothetical protein
MPISLISIFENAIHGLQRRQEVRLKKKNEILESKGYKIGSVDEFLGLSKEESQYIELKLSLSQALAEHRKKTN